MTVHPKNPLDLMPEPAPLAMPTQDLTRSFRDADAPELTMISGTWGYRLATFVPAIMTTIVLMAVFVEWFQKGGFVATEIAMIILVGFSSFWITLSVAASTIGLFFGKQDQPAPKANLANALDVALVVPVYNEDAKAVFSRLQAMRKELSQASTNHRFAIFVLSDTSCEQKTGQEEWWINQCRTFSPTELPIYYRRRTQNTERKTGNIREWVENWGASWDAFITLDADSLMSAKAISRLANEMAEAPEAGLIQTVPRLHGAGSLFSKVQQFANNTYGAVLARGLDRWSGNEGNYWGHNAIIRTKAFATCAGLPRLSGSGALGGTIKSHDFVEAALLRRAGWAVRLFPEISESYEETPQTVVDYVLRDRRWCQGNLQHLRLIFSKGLNNASRFHMVQGAMAYVASVVWFVLLIVWALMGRGENETVFRYFTDTNPLFPQWPQMDVVSRVVILAFMFALLLAPKLFGILAVVKREPALKSHGGPIQFAISCISEILLSFVLAPILMVQHVTAVARTVVGLDAGWAPQNRESNEISFFGLLRFHMLETVVGVLLVTGIALGVVSLWLVPIAASLIFAVPLSYAVSSALPNKSWMNNLLSTAENNTPSAVLDAAHTTATSLEGTARAKGVKEKQFA